MPILLNDIREAVSSDAPTPKQQTPKYFYSGLTGNGRNQQGLLNASLHPGRYPAGMDRFQAPSTNIFFRDKSSSGTVTNHFIPINPVTQTSYGWSSEHYKVPVPDKDSEFAVKLSDDRFDDIFQIWADCHVQGLVLHEDVGQNSTTRQAHISYRTTIYFVPTGQTEAVVINITEGGTSQTDKFDKQGIAWAVPTWSYAPVDDIDDIPWANLNISAVFATNTQQQSAATINRAAMKEKLEQFYADFNVYANIVDAATTWNTDRIAEGMDRLIKALTTVPDDDYVTSVQKIGRQLSYLETYPVPLSAYRAIYNSIATYCSEEATRYLVKQNINLLMNSALADLQEKRDQLHQAPASMATHPVPQWYSNQQKAALTTTEPLAMIQAGAGSGKSTIVLGRIQQLKECGVQPETITVLSFTNAAADNITKKNPSVKSMTIARMIHEIYHEYFPTHELSSLETISNSLMIYMPDDKVIADFAALLHKITRRGAQGSAYTHLNNFVEANLETVVSALNTLRQTTLELEIILAYHMIDRMPLPTKLNIHHLIIDEVQDTSVFEFIYLLRLAHKLECSMFLIGDASQTLYEFRAANPKALNALEASGAFASYKLETNYRSNQEILDFANVHLADIEANQLAKIQLQANSLTPVTPESFQEKVQLEYISTNDRDYIRDLPGLISHYTKDYTQACLDRGEKVAFLAFTRREANIVQKKLEAMFPDRSVISMISDRRRPTTFFSEFIREDWADITMLDPTNAPYAFAREVVVRNLTSSAHAEKMLRSMTSQWWIENARAIQGWIYETQQHMISNDTFFERMRETILNYEIEYNAVREQVMHRSNQERKIANMQANADLIVSTIHGVKGLEFDNVVLLHKDESGSMSEDKKRLYYVALTRAMKSEFILSRGRNLSSRIQSDYDLVLNTLEKN